MSAGSKLPTSGYMLQVCNKCHRYTDILKTNFINLVRVEEWNNVENEASSWFKYVIHSAIGMLFGGGVGLIVFGLNVQLP